MKLRIPHSLILLPFMLAGAVNAAQSTVGSDLYQKEDINAQQVPAQALEAVQKLAPGFQLQEAEQETKHGNQYLDLEGVTSTGEEIEFDMLLNADSVWEVVEIQKDLQLENTPTVVQDLFNKTFSNKQPARIIESQQMDGLVIYEFYFVEEGKTTKQEIKLDGDKASLLEQEWVH